MKHMETPHKAYTAAPPTSDHEERTLRLTNTEGARILVERDVIVARDGVSVEQ